MKKQNKRIDCLDGLRFIAISFIVASHCLFLEQGGIGNNIFFSLSGFFVAYTCKDEISEKFYNIKNILSFYIKKIIRIIPTFWFYLLFTAIFFYEDYYLFLDFSSEHSLILNMLLIKPLGHIWFLQQEMTFYLLVPLIFIVLYALRMLFIKNEKKHTNYLFNSFILFILAIVYLLFAGDIKIFNNSNIDHQTFRLGLFLLGMSTGFLCKLVENKNYHFIKKKGYRFITNVVVILFILFCIFSSNKFLRIIDMKYIDYCIGWKLPITCTCFCCIVIFLLVTSKDTFVNKLLSNKLFVFIGRISYTIYLFHWPFLVLKHPKPSIRFVLVYFVTICVSYVINKYIEKPTITFYKRFF